MSGAWLVISSSSMLDEEHRAAGVALAAGPPAQLVVEPAARVPAGADHVQAAELGDLVVLGRAVAPASLPPSRMSVPRPAICVDTVIAP